MQGGLKPFHFVRQVMVVVAVSGRPVLDVLFDVMKQPVHFMQVLRDVVLVIHSSVC